MMDTTKDVAYEKLTNDFLQDITTAEEIADKILNVLDKEFEEKKDLLEVKHFFLALSRSITMLTKSLCSSQDHFLSELEKSSAMVIEKMLPSIFPKTQDGVIVEEGYDQEDLSTRRILMAISYAIEYTLWRVELSNYQEIRQELEIKELEEIKEEVISEETE